VVSAGHRTTAKRDTTASALAALIDTFERHEPEPLETRRDVDISRWQDAHRARPRHAPLPPELAHRLGLASSLLGHIPLEKALDVVNDTYAEWMFSAVAIRVTSRGYHYGYATELPEIAFEVAPSGRLTRWSRGERVGAQIGEQETVSQLRS
jgi:hypothetical protein